MNKRELWLRIRNYHFTHLVTPNMWDKLHETFGGTDACTHAFADKISRKHSWKKSFSLKAVAEYKKYIYLGVVSRFHVTPSKVIDVVWHEHILFTNAYNDFCKDIIEYRFDHYPELLKAENDIEKFNAQYLSTIQLYFHEFGKLPPADVWQVTKFDKDKVLHDLIDLKKKRNRAELYYSNNTYADDTSLFENFESREITEGSMLEFGHGDFGGGGADGSWGDEGSDSNSGDGGSGDGGSSCSSGCSGGD